MGLLHLYMSARGRISRKAWWLGAIGLGAGYLLLRQALGLILQYEPIAASSGDATAQLSWVTEDSHSLHTLLSVILTAITCVLGYFLSVKRRQDRGARGWDVAIAFGVPVVLALLAYASLLLPSRDTAPTGPDGLSLTLFLFSAYIYQPFALYVVVVLGLLKGTNGPNRFGPDPLSAQPVLKQEAS